MFLKFQRIGGTSVVQQCGTQRKPSDLGLFGATPGPFGGRWGRRFGEDVWAFLGVFEVKAYTRKSVVQDRGTQRKPMRTGSSQTQILFNCLLKGFVLLYLNIYISKYLYIYISIYIYISAAVPHLRGVCVALDF